MTVQRYIQENMDRTLRQNVKDDGTLIGLPHPYTVPCADGMFNELYYWDTYFTNKALFALGQAEQAKNNIKDILRIEKDRRNMNLSRLFCFFGCVCLFVLCCFWHLLLQINMF